MMSININFQTQKHIFFFINIFSTLLWCALCQAQTISVPEDFKRIQAALNHAQKGDTIYVTEGTYHETIQWPATYGIQLIGEIGKTTIDAKSKGRVFSFYADLKGLIDHNTLIQGFTLKNGSPDQNMLYGGGIYCHSASPHLKQLIICDSKAHKGGGLFCFQSNVLLTHVMIVNNLAKSGGGIACEYCKPELVNVTISENVANSGAAIHAFISSLKLHNVTIIQNMASQMNAYCNAVYLNSSHLMMNYSLIWNRGTKHEIFFSKYDQQNTLTIRHSLIREEHQCIVTHNNGKINQSDNQIQTSSSLYLSPQSDTGIDPTDNITNLNKIQLMAKGIQGNCLDIFEKGTQHPITRTCLSNDVFSTNIDLSEGIHTIYAHPANPSYTILKLPSAITITVDQTAPVIEELSLIQTAGDKKQWMFISQDNDPELQYAYWMNQKEVAQPVQNYSRTQSARFEVPDLTDGKWFVHVKAMDRAGNESPVYTFKTTIDNTAPEIQILDITKNHLIQHWTWCSIKKESDIVFRYWVDQHALSKPTGAFSEITSTKLSGVNGRWYLHVQAKDSFGNLSKVVTSSAHMDNIPPQLKGVSDDPVPKKEKLWKWESNEPGTLYRFKISKAPKYTLSAPFKKLQEAKISQLDGRYYLHIQAKDTSGNVSDPQMFYCILDNTKPMVIQLNDDPTPTQMKSWKWSATDADPELSFRFSVDPHQQSELKNAFSHTTTANLKDKDGTWYLHVQAKDRAGNLSQVVTVSAIMDNTPPVVKGLKDDPVPRQFKQWTWISNEPDTRFRYQINKQSQALLDMPFISNNSTKIADENGRLYLHVQAKDLAGNISDVLTVSAVLDNTGPELTNLSDDPVPTQTKTWAWGSNEPETTYRYQIDTQLETSLNKPFSDRNSATLSNRDGKYFLHVQGKDKAGNLGKPLTVFCVLDNTKPVITGLSDDSVPTKGKVWKWSATDADSILRYRHLIDQNKIPNLAEKFHSITSASIQDKNGIWYLHVQAQDRAGNMSKIKSVFKLLDNIPPFLMLNAPDRNNNIWNWSSKDLNPPILYHFRCDRNPDYHPGLFSTKTTFDPIGCIFNAPNEARQLKDLNGRWYFHIQAKDRAQNTTTRKETFLFDFTNKGLYANLQIMFKLNSTQMNPHSLGLLKKLSQIMSKYSDAIAIIEAHTDSIGDDTYNLNLSERRAEAIKEYLNKRLNIPLDRMKSKGYGETIPIADNETAAGRKQNRRAEVILKAR